MKIPESIRIGGVEYKIKHVERVNNGMEIACGSIDYDLSEIELSSDIKASHDKKCQTLLHEILHGIRKHANLVISDEEIVVDTLAIGLYQVLQDNGGRLFDIVPEQKEEKET